ncbi:unnamed protein product [Plutella xylostella]|uniref:(diamondback moth) hypothetical protein n=1 Tax=Plutella xylostella TaxID=51655 RepID=A0A8S4DED6_PLUXY|nr:unnamed protein product [Plutella xylostella]
MHECYFMENCLEILVEFCENKAEYVNYLDPNVPLSLMERRTELEVRATKSDALQVTPSCPKFGKAPPTTGLVVALADVIYNVAAFANCPVLAWNEQGLFRLLFKCTSWSSAARSDNAAVRAATCRALARAADAHPAVRAALASTRDCLHNMLDTLAPADDGNTWTLSCSRTERQRGSKSGNTRDCLHNMLDTLAPADDGNIWTLSCSRTERQRGSKSGNTRDCLHNMLDTLAPADDGNTWTLSCSRTERQRGSKSGNIRDCLHNMLDTLAPADDGNIWTLSCSRTERQRGSKSGNTRDCLHNMLDTLAPADDGNIWTLSCSRTERQRGTARSDNAAVRAATCRALARVADAHPAVRAVLASTRDCLHSLMEALAPADDGNIWTLSCSRTERQRGSKSGNTRDCLHNMLDTLAPADDGNIWTLSCSRTERQRGSKSGNTRDCLHNMLDTLAPADDGNIWTLSCSRTERQRGSKSGNTRDCLHNMLDTLAPADDGNIWTLSCSRTERQRGSKSGNTRDCLHNMLDTLAPADDEDFTKEHISALAQALLLLSTLLRERAACDSVWRQLREDHSGTFFHLLLQTLEVDESELQEAGLYCIASLSQSISKTKHKDDATDDSWIQLIDNLKSPYFEIDTPRVKEDFCSGDGPDSNCQPEYLVEELCKNLMYLYQKHSVDKRNFQASPEGNWTQACSSLSSLLSVSGRARHYAVHREFNKTLLLTLHGVRDHLSMHGKTADVIRMNADSNPVLLTLYWLLTTMASLMTECVRAKESFAADGIAVSLLRLWPWCMMTSQLRTVVVQLLLSFTNGCPAEEILYICPQAFSTATTLEKYTF